MRGLQWQKRTRQRQRIEDEKRGRQRHAQPLAGSPDERPIVARAIMRDKGQISNVREECLQGLPGRWRIAHFIHRDLRQFYDMSRNRHTRAHECRPRLLGKAINPAPGGNLDDFRCR